MAGQKNKVHLKVRKKARKLFFSKFCFHDAKAIQGEVRGQANNQSQIQGVREK